MIHHDDPICHDPPRHEDALWKMNTTEAAAYLQVHPSTLARWRVEGTGPAYSTLGRRCRYSRADLDAWMAMGQVTPTPPSQDAVGRAVELAQMALAAKSQVAMEMALSRIVELLEG